MEVCWLAALILVPCLCNPFAESEFQPAKILIFRILAVLLAAAWLSKLAATRPRPGEWVARFASSFRRWPIAWGLAAMAVVYLAANCFSINPSASFWGSYDYRQGTFTFICGLIFVAAAGMHLRRREQIDRLVSTISITGFVLSLYAIFERAGHGNLPVLEHNRVFSFLGHPMYFADYLVLIIPITGWRLWLLAATARSGETGRSIHWTGLVLYTVMMLFQLLACFFTGTRAGLLGLVAGAIFVTLTISALDQRRSRVLGGLGIVVIILALLAVLNLRNGPLNRLSGMPILERYTQVFSQKEAAASLRIEYWNAAARIVSWKTPMKFPGGVTDQWHSLRSLIGYGPETQGSVLSREFSDPDPNPNLNDRVHNSFWDTWLSLGFLGVVAQAALYSLAFYQAYRRLGLMFSLRRKCVFFGGLAGLSLGGGLLLETVFRNTGLTGVGMEFGMAVGLVLFPLTALFQKGDAAKDAKTSLERHSLLVFVLGALLSHLVDNIFGFETSATLTLVAIYLGTILALDGEEGEAEFKAPLPICDFSTSNSPATPSYTYPVIGTGLILASMLFAFITHYQASQAGGWEVFLNTLTPFGDRHSSRNSYTLLFLLVSWLFVAVSFGWEQGFSTRSSNWLKGGLFVLITSGALAMAYALFQAQMLARVGPLPDGYATLKDVHRQGLGYLQICAGFIGFCLLCVIAGGLAFRAAKPLANQHTHRLVPMICAAAAVLVIWFLCMPALEAEVLCKWADILQEADKFKLSAGLYGQVVGLDSSPEIYREKYAQTLQNLAEADPDPGLYDELMTQAEAGLLRGQGDGMDATDLSLGMLYLQWGAHQESPEAQVKIEQKAKSSFQNAQLFEPFNQLTWRASSIANHLLLHDDETARAELERARALTRTQDKQPLGEFFSSLAASISNPGLRQEYDACALEYFDLALAEDATNTDENALLQVHLERGYANLVLGREEMAIQDYSDAAQLTAQPDSWKAEFWMARIYAREDKPGLVDQHLQRAMSAAPPDQKQMLLAWKLRLANQ